ncbi:MAG: Ig-like domain-containing protein [Candidatus Tectomicrobia bacterium]|uniref:Ig-like domain-containing protein n=1 Tax=Tectimicrobiota bacterium TaxID=2528274 RepID=A0A933LQU3_UNCTE|nr:Ig-like domain-containing protein [Candidatus Tectomicrobia bacterium]
MRCKFLFVLTLMGLFLMAGCSSLLKNTIKDTAGPSSPSQYFLSIQSDPKELPYPAAQTEIRVKVRDVQGKPVPGATVYLYPGFPYAGWLYEEILVTDNDGTAKTIFKDTVLYGGTQYVEARLENLRALVYIWLIPIGGPHVP